MKCLNFYFNLLHSGKCSLRYFIFKSPFYRSQNIAFFSICNGSYFSKKLNSPCASFYTSTSFLTRQYCSLPNGSSSDGVDIGEGTWEEVYKGILSTQIKLLKIFSVSTSAFGLMVQPILLQKIMGSNLGVYVALGSFVGFFTVVTPILIHWVTKKYVTRLEYDPVKDLYSATTLSFFLQENKIHFYIKDVAVPDVPGLFTTFLANNRPLFVDPELFHNLEHYGRLMGYNKPIDLRLKLKEKQR